MDGSSYTKITGVTSFTPPTITVQTFDKTSYDSPIGYREAISALKEGDEASFEMHFTSIDASQVALYGAQGGAPVYFKAVLGAKHMFWMALILKFEIPQVVGNLVKAICTFKLTGALVYETIPDPSQAPILDFSSNLNSWYYGQVA